MEIKDKKKVGVSVVAILISLLGLAYALMDDNPETVPDVSSTINTVVEEVGNIRDSIE